MEINRPPRARLWSRLHLLGMAVVGVSLLTLAVAWTFLGTDFYRSVLPFYDSLSYRGQYLAILRLNETQGVSATLNSVWHDTNSNVVLFKVFAALFGGILPSSATGLYGYLFSIHLGGMAGLAAITWWRTRSVGLALLALAIWLAARPFGLSLYGVLDQRMDLATSSFFLAIGACSLWWVRLPRAGTSLILGTVCALAVLHRPVMAVTIAGTIGIFSVRAMFRTTLTWSGLLRHLGWVALPGLVLTVPWLLVHRRELEFYYLIWNNAVGNAETMREAAVVNLGYCYEAMSPAYVGALLTLLSWAAWRRRMDWADLAALLLAALLPLVLLILTRSTGNSLVPQMPVGLLVLALSCVKPPKPTAIPERAPALLMGASGALALMAVIVTSLVSLKHAVAAERVEPRREIMRTIAQLRGMQLGPHPKLATFSSFPVDAYGIVALAAEEGAILEVGHLYFHTMDFGIANAADAALSDAAREIYLRAAIEQIKVSDSLLMLPTAETEHLLPMVNFAHVHQSALRKLVEADPAFVRVLTTEPINGVKLSFFTIRR